jgi:hypothetical protein
MKTNIFIYCLVFIMCLGKSTAYGQFENKIQTDPMDYIIAFTDTLNSLSEKSDNVFFKMHCKSMVSVIDSRNFLTDQDLTYIKNTYNAFNNNSDPANPKKLTTYLKRARPFIISWVSPTDGAVSFSWLTLPKDWGPQRKYPLYIQLHGLWNVADEPIVYMTYPYLNAASSSFSFEDGYLLSPWGRGNLWYEGISETDIWEGMAALGKIVKIDPMRKYLSGHSMGGYGAWHIASKSPKTWAALGIHAGALWYGGYNLVNTGVAKVMNGLPTYFVCGTVDGLLGINQEAYNLLKDAGNQNIQFVTFEGGHEYIEKNVQNMYLWMHQFVNDNPVTEINGPQEISQLANKIRNFPNPVSSTTQVLFTLSRYSHVRIAIYDICGKKIENLLDEQKAPGNYEFLFDASGLNNGIYFICMVTESSNCGSKMTVAR